MTNTINYDQHIKNFIDELSDTGHVYHTKYKKTSVTFHHNGGNLSFEDVLRTWTFKKASAHFDSNEFGNLAQFVHVLEYAWAVGDTEGNKKSISIEMANKTGAPHWEVNEATWKSAARLAGWLFAHVIEEAPTEKNVLLHDHWSATECPGPYIHSIYKELLDEVQHWYRHFHKLIQEKHTNEEPNPNEESHHTKGEEIIRAIQDLLDLTVDGKWGPKTDEAVLAFRKKYLNKL